MNGRHRAEIASGSRLLTRAILEKETDLESAATTVDAITRSLLREVGRETVLGTPHYGGALAPPPLPGGLSLAMSETAVDACERAVRRAILLGEHAPGSLLPPERALADELGVNRTTLRGALSRLAAARLLTVRQGSGYRVQDYRRVAGFELLPELAGLADDATRFEIVRDVLAVRRRLALLVFERISERPDPRHADAVERAVDRFEQVIEAGGDLDAVADADLDVTAAILAATGSPVLGLVLNPITFVVRELRVLRELIYAEPLTNVAGYRVAVRWLRAPSPEAVALLAQEMERRDALTLSRLRARGTGNE